jgi:hypothetical protein
MSELIAPSFNSQRLAIRHKTTRSSFHTSHVVKSKRSGNGLAQHCTHVRAPMHIGETKVGLELPMH